MIRVKKQEERKGVDGWRGDEAMVGNKGRNMERRLSDVKKRLMDGLREKETVIRVRKQEERTGVHGWRGKEVMIRNKERKK